MKELTRRQAWTVIKKEFQNYNDEGLSRTGLCYAVGVLYDEKRINLEVALWMDKDIKSVEPEDFNESPLMHYWPRDAAGAKQRVKAINKILKSI